MPLPHAVLRELRCWDALDGDAWFAFELFWAPPSSPEQERPGGPWETWAQFLADSQRARPQHSP